MMFLRRGHHDTSSGQFDREVFDEKMKTFDALVHGSDISGEIVAAPASSDDDILSLDDSVIDSPVPVKKPSAHAGNKGALEQTLMISPAKRPKKPQKSPVSSSSRKGLSRFLSLRSLQDAENRSERNLGELEAIWQCSDIMSVAASVPAELDLADIGTLATFDPSTSKRGKLRRASKASFLPKQEDDEDFRSASVSGFLDASGKERKRSTSLEPATSNQRLDDDILSVVDNAIIHKSPRRKLKKDGIHHLSQSDHVMSMVSPVPCLTPPERDTKSNRVLVRSKASADPGLPTVPSISPSSRGKWIHVPPKESPKGSSKESPKEKTKKKKSKPKPETTEDNVDAGPINNEVVIIMSRETDPPGQKKKRSKSLSRLNLYDHESVDKSKRDPSKRRGGKKERRPSKAGENTVEESSTRRSTGTISCAGESPKLRLSRRQLMKIMDSESVFSAPARAGSNSRPGSGRSPSPRPGRMTPTLPRRRDSERGTLGISLHRQGSTRVLDRSRHDIGQDQEQSIHPGSPSILPRRGDSLRNLNGPSSATTPRRKLSTNSLAKSGTEDRRELLKRIDSVNSFFGKGKGELGSAFPSAAERNSWQESGKPNRPAQGDKSDKGRLRRSYRNLSVT